MNLYLRLLILFIRAKWKPALKITDLSVLHFHVLPSDLDINMHMNNGRFNSIMDLGRVDIMLRSGLLKLIYRKGWQGVVGTIHTHFRRPLKCFQSYELHSQVVYWDNKWTWIEHKMYSQDKLICHALVQTLIRGKGENISNEKLQELMGFDIPSPEITADIAHLESFGTSQ